MGFFAERRPSGIMYVAALSGILLAAAATRLADPDVWWHLTAGWVITHLREIPRYDLFSYTAFGAPWVDLEWLFEAVESLLFEFGGLAGLLALKVALSATMAWIFFRTVVLLTRSRSAALWATALLLWGTAIRLSERPHLLGLCLLGAFCLILHRQVRTGTRMILALPLLELLWINCHGSAILGAQIVFVFAAGESLHLLLAPRLGGPEPIPTDRIRELWLAGAACAAACLLNPWGVGILEFNIDCLFRIPTILRYTVEWFTPFHPMFDGSIDPIIATTAVIAGMGSFIVNRRKTRLSHLLLFGMAAMLLPRGYRFIPDVLLICLPITFANFEDAARRISLRPKAGHAYAWLHLVLITTLSWSAISYGIPLTFKGEFWNSASERPLTVGAPAYLVNFLEYHKIHGRVLNDMGMGGYLIFRRWPHERVFIDGRTPVYGDAFFRDFVEALLFPHNFDALEKRWQFDYLVFPAHSGWGLRKLHQKLWEDPNWRLVYAAGDGFVYLRNEPKFRQLIRKLALKRHPIIEMMKREEERKRREIDNQAPHG